MEQWTRGFCLYFWIMSGAGQFWMILWLMRLSVGVWERKTENKGKRFKHGIYKTFRQRGANRVNLATPAELYCAAQEPQRSAEAIKYEHRSSKLGNWYQKKWNQTNSLAWTSHVKLWWQLKEPRAGQYDLWIISQYFQAISRYTINIYISKHFKDSTKGLNKCAI